METVEVTVDMASVDEVVVSLDSFSVLCLAVAEVVSVASVGMVLDWAVCSITITTPM